MGLKTANEAPGAAARSTAESREAPSDLDRRGAEDRSERNAEAFSSIDLLNLLRQYREAEGEVRRSTRASTQVKERDLVALRFLVRMREAGRVPRQKDLAEALGLTAASTSVLVDRLSRDGYVRRVAHPEDRRSVGIEVLGETNREVEATLSGIPARMIEVTKALTDEERAGAAKFLQGLLQSVSERHGADSERD